MIEDPALKNLIFYSNPIPEMEEDEDDIDRDIITANFVSNTVDILDNIGNENFKYIYQNVISSIKESIFEKQIDFCYEILEKINYIYDFEFIRKIDIGEKDIPLIYRFLEFLEFDNIEFFENLLDGLIIDLRKVDITDFILKEWKELENRILDMELEEFISDFLRTNTKNNLVSFFTNSINKSKEEIITKFLE